VIGRRTRGAALVALGLWAVGAPARAQGTRAAIEGVVADSGGAPVRTVTVILASTASDVERRFVTDADGAFVFGGLEPGIYYAHIEEAAYMRYMSAPIEVAAGQRRALAIALTALPPAPEAPAAEASAGVPDYAASPDRWGAFRGRALNPYERNRLKGDYPVIGQDVFVVVTGVSDTAIESMLGGNEQLSIAPQLLVSLEVFKGNTAFRPRDWAFRVTPALAATYASSGERGIVDITRGAGLGPRRGDLALQEAFAERKLLDVGPNYDFISIRAGIQPFTSDFRGFLYRDANLGVRAFGNWGRNRNQWNIAYFDQLEKDRASRFNLMERRDQQVFIANYFQQDFLTPGYTISPSVHANVDRGLTAYYAGVGGDGHWGPLNITHQFYQVFGRDDGVVGAVAPQLDDSVVGAGFSRLGGMTINAQFAVIEASVDRDWWRFKATAMFASGDAEPADARARGFDAIADNPNIAGGAFSLWNRQGIRLANTPLAIVGRFSPLPSMRSSADPRRAQFVNPGLLEYSVGWDADLTVKLQATANVSVLQFHRTEPLTALLQLPTGRTIGVDSNVGFQYRPLLSENVVVTMGGSWLTPSQSFRSLLPGGSLFAPFVVLSLRY
jgi:hypothetical protein